MNLIPTVIETTARGEKAYSRLLKDIFDSRTTLLEKTFYEEEDNDFEMTELEAFNADLRLAEFTARVEKGELTEGEQAGLNALRFGIDFPLPDELKNV